MDEKLLLEFDKLIKDKGYENRSEAVRDLVRRNLVEEAWENEEEIVAGSILLFYDHHQRDLLQELTSVQHGKHDLIMATTHFHLDEAYCLELIVVKGTAKDLKKLSDQMICLRGVKFGKLTISPFTG